MQVDFVKYQGTGNDFIMIDGRDHRFEFSNAQVQRICDRRFGIGADGLIVLLSHPEYDFEMDYYNSDGSKSFCGNGSRCAQAFARELGMIEDDSRFLAIDGMHEGRINGSFYETHMGDVGPDRIQRKNTDWFIHTGSPHYIVFKESLDTVDVLKEGRAIRYSPEYAKNGVNVNFVQRIGQAIRVRTYERGVEAETLSCGTGVTAAAIAHVLESKQEPTEVNISTAGGELSVKLEKSNSEAFHSIWLVGPAEKVFEGSYSF